MDHTSPLDLPAERLGALLRNARRGAHLSRRRAARITGIHSAQLIAYERGWDAVPSELLDALLALYGTDSYSLVPAREPIVVAHPELSFGREVRVLASTARDDVLRGYAELLQRARRAGKADRFAFRQADLAVLGEILDTDTDVLAERLVHLLDCDDDEARSLAHELRRKLALPLAGAAIGAVAFGGIAAATSTPHAVPQVGSHPPTTTSLPVSTSTVEHASTTTEAPVTTTSSTVVAPSTTTTVAPPSTSTTTPVTPSTLPADLSSNVTPTASPDDQQAVGVFPGETPTEIIHGGGSTP